MATASFLAHTPEPDPWYAVADVPRQRRWACLNRRQLYTAIAAGELRAARVGQRRLFVRGSWVDDWLTSRATPRELPRVG